MMNDSYIDEIKKSFPQIKLPLTEAQLKRFEAVARMKPQEIYVEKSERILALEKELATARNLYARANAIADAWDMKNWGKFPRFKVPYVHCPQLESPKSAIDSILADAEQDVNSFVARMHCAAKDLRQMVTFAYNELDAALDAEKKGVAGENQVEDYLIRNLNCRILSSVILPTFDNWGSGPKTAETDLLVISEHGIYVCEVKNYGKVGQTLEVAPNGEMIKKDAGRVVENMGSPFQQNARHCKAVENVLTSAGMVGIPVYSAVIMANTDVKIVNNSQYQVFDMYSFCEHISGKKMVKLTMPQCQAAFDVIQSKRMTERKFPIPAVSSVFNALKVELECLEQGTEEKESLRKAMQEDVRQWIDDSGARWAAVHKRPFRIERMVSVMMTASVWAIAVWTAVFGVKMLLLDVSASSKVICVGAVLLVASLAFMIWAKALPIINQRVYSARSSILVNFFKMVAIHTCIVVGLVFLIASSPLCDVFAGEVPDDLL